MAEWLFNNLVPVLVVLVVIIYVTAWRTLAPRRPTLKDAGVKFGPETDSHPWDSIPPPNTDENYWRTSPYRGHVNFGGFPGTSAADIYSCDPAPGMSTGLHDKEFVIPDRDPWKHDKVKTVAEYDAESSIETSECCATSYTELMGRLRTGTLQPADMPSKLPVTFEMLLSLVMTMIDTHERKGDAKVCDDVFVLLRRRYDSTSLNHVPEARYLELWVDLKQLERNRG